MLPFLWCLDWFILSKEVKLGGAAVKRYTKLKKSVLTLNTGVLMQTFHVKLWRIPRLGICFFLYLPVRCCWRVQPVNWPGQYSGSVSVVLTEETQSETNLITYLFIQLEYNNTPTTIILWQKKRHGPPTTGLCYKCLTFTGQMTQYSHVRLNTEQLTENRCCFQNTSLRNTQQNLTVELQMFKYHSALMVGTKKKACCVTNSMFSWWIPTVLPAVVVLNRLI